MILQSNEIISHYSDLPMLKAYHSKRPPFRREHIRHCHSAFEVALVLGGKGLYRVDDFVYSFEQGDVFLFSTNELHCITEVFEGEDLHLINLQFEPRFIWIPGNDTFDLRYLDVFFHRSPCFRHQLKHDDPRAADIRDLLMKIDAEFKCKNSFYEMMVKNMLLTALVYVRRNFEEYFIENAAPQKARMVRRLAEVMQYIDENLSDSLTLEQLSLKANMSRSHFSALFTALNGLSAGEYIIQKRVSHAARLLQTTAVPVMEIATACGFNSAANFNHAFKKQTGKTPTQYRRELKI